MAGWFWLCLWHDVTANNAAIAPRMLDSPNLVKLTAVMGPGSVTHSAVTAGEANGRD